MKDLWDDVNSNGLIKDFHLLATNNGKIIDFDTKVEYFLGDNNGSQLAWGQAFEFPLLITHKATDDSFTYKVSIMGVTSQNSSTNYVAMAKNDKKYRGGPQNSDR